MTYTIGSYKVNWKSIILASLVAVYLLVNLFQVGGSAFVFNLNNLVVLPLALGVTFLAIKLWHPSLAGGQNRVLWSGLTIGWGLWTAAELWWAITAFLGQEVPYPSWADLFWLAGYAPMYIALSARIRSLPKIVNPAQRIGLGAISMVALLSLILFVFAPMIRENAPTVSVQSILNLLYPLADSILLVFVLRIFFIYQHGMYGRAWRWLTVGFILFALGDLIFAYANTFDLYYPEGQATLLSTFVVDIPYNLSYLFFLVGLFWMQTIHSTHGNIEEIKDELALVPNTHVLIFTKGNDTVIDVSENFSRVFPQDKIMGLAIAPLLGMSPRDVELLLPVIKANGIFQERAFMVRTCRGQEQVLISGMVVRNPQGEYAGVTLLLRLHYDDYFLDELLSEHQQGIAGSLLRRTGTGQKEEKEIRNLLEGYYQELLKTFYNHVIFEGGSILADVFITELQLVAQQHQWQIKIQPNSLLDASGGTLAEVQEALPILFETAKRFAIKIMDNETVNKMVQDVHSRFGESIVKNVSYYERAKLTQLSS